MSAVEAAPKDARRPLCDRVVLVVGADDPTTRRTALHLAARGAALIVAGVHRQEVLVTAGLGAASGATTRVIEAPSPTFSGAALVDAAIHLLARPTDMLLSEAVVATSPTLPPELRELLGRRAFSSVVPERPTGGDRAFAAATCAAFEAAVRRFAAT